VAARPFRSEATVAREGRRRSRGQALVELSLLAPLLIALGLGTSDFGRAFGLNEAINGAAREAARQAAYYDYNTATNPTYNSDSLILQVAQKELGATGTGAKLSLAPIPDQSQSFCSAPPATAYPTTADTGLLYLCRTAAASSADGRNHVTVSILWRMQLLTPVVNVVGVPLLHGTVDATEQSS
jgi:Flp pilus assembly protein TadG